MKYLRLEKGVVAEIIPEFDKAFPAMSVDERYPAEFIRKLVKTNDDTDVQHGMTMSADGGFAFPVTDANITDTFSDIVSKKLKELSSVCSSNITNGIELDGRHYSMTITDQLNMSALRIEIMNGAENVTYHADGEPAKIYSKEDFIILYNTCQSHKLRENAYFNQLKQYVLSLGTADAVKNVRYGQPLTGSFLESYRTVTSDL